MDQYHEPMDSLSGGDSAASTAPLVLFMGPQHSGKTSIQQVVFARMNPHETQFCEATTKPAGLLYPPPGPTVSREALLSCRIMDMPGNTQFLDQFKDITISLLQSARCLIFVIDVQNESSWPEAIEMLLQALFIIQAHSSSNGGSAGGGSGGNSGENNNNHHNASAAAQQPACNVSVLLHKNDPAIQTAATSVGGTNGTVGGMGGQTSTQNGDSGMSSYTKLRQMVVDRLRKTNVQINVSFYITSLFNTSIYEAVSRILHTIVPRSALLNTLLDGFSNSCGYDKTMLIDLGTKLYLAADSSNSDPGVFQLLSQLLDLVLEVSAVYAPVTSPQLLFIDGEQHSSLDHQFGSGSGSGNGSNNGNTVGNNNGNNNNNNSGYEILQDDDPQFCYTSDIEFASGNTLLLRQLNNHTVLLISYTSNKTASLQQGGGYASLKNLQEFNLTCLKQALARICNLRVFGVDVSTHQDPNVIDLQAAGNNPDAAAAAAAAFGVKQYLGSYASSNAMTNIREFYASIGSFAPASLAAASPFASLNNTNNPNFARSPTALVGSSSRANLGAAVGQFQQQQMQQQMQQQQQQQQQQFGISSSFNMQNGGTAPSRFVSGSNPDVPR